MQSIASLALFTLLRNDCAMKTPPPPPIAARIRQAIECSGKKQVEVAKLMQVSRQCVQGWVRTGRIAKPHLSRLAEVLNVSLEWLIHGNVPMKALPARPRRFVPLLSWADLALSAGPQEGTVYIETSALVGAGSYGLPIDGDWMQGEMPPGSVAIIDPDRTAKPGDYVCAAVEGRYVLRQYLREGDAVVLKAVNTAYPPIIAAAGSVKILGVVARVEKDY